MSDQPSERARKLFDDLTDLMNDTAGRDYIPLDTGLAAIQAALDEAVAEEREAIAQYVKEAGYRWTARAIRSRSRA